MISFTKLLHHVTILRN